MTDEPARPDAALPSAARLDQRSAVHDADIVVIDDEPMNLSLLDRLLRRDGYRRIEATTDAGAAVERCRSHPPDLLLLDLGMPGLDGFGVLEALSVQRAGPGHFPIVVLTGAATTATRRRALIAGADDFLGKPIDAIETMLRASNLIALHRMRQAMRDDNARLERVVRERTHDLEVARSEVLERLALASEYRDDVTQQHAKRIGALSRRIAEASGHDDDLVATIERAASLHDIGKLAIPDAVLLTPGRLDPAEREVMEQHAPLGAHMLEGSHSPLLRLAESIAMSHHERWDGTGYPRRLAGDQIPRAARIVALVDVFDALTHERPYKAAWPVDDALAEIKAGAGTQFDPELVGVFLQVEART